MPCVFYISYWKLALCKITTYTQFRWKIRRLISAWRVAAWIDDALCLFVSFKWKSSFMQNSYIYSFRASVSHWAYIALLNLRVRRTQSLFAASMYLYFRGGRHRATRWVLRWRRLLVWGSQVAAWDRGTSWLGDVYWRPLRPYICFLLLDNTTRFRLSNCRICDPFAL